jgi:hypothetical protein
MSQNDYIHDDDCRVFPVREILQSCSEQVLNEMKGNIEICSCCKEIFPKNTEKSISTTGKCKLCNSLYEELRRDSFEALENMLAISRYLKIEMKQ